jgi:protein CpxP
MRLQWKCVLFLAACTLVWGQGPPPAPAPAPGPPPNQGPGHRAGPVPGGEMQGGPRQSPGGKWWDNPEMVKRLGITADQQKKMDDVFQQSRLKLIDLSATLEKEEVMMEGLLKGPQLDDARILPAVDRIAQARAELEKANARLMLAIRHVLTPEQWEKLNEQGPMPRRAGPGMPGRGPGPGPGRPPQEEE